MSGSKAFPGFSNIYVLEDTGNSVAFRGKISLDDQFVVTRAEETPTGPVEVRWAMGRKKPSDIIHTTYVTPLLISDRVASILEGGEHSGWQTYPVELSGKDGLRIPGYRGFAVSGRCGPIDESRCVRLDKIYPGGVFPAWYGMYFDPATWDGSDLFMPSGRVGWIFAVEAVKKAFEKAKVTNVAFTSLDKKEVQRLL
ncbi:MAG TPA: hypothetical protein VIG99_19980 [Myxococcaceae bacterium]